MDLAPEALAARVLHDLRGRYKTVDGADARTSECGRSYNHYSVSCTLPGADGAPGVAAARLQRSIDELLDALGGETRHGLLVVRQGGVTVERLSAECASPVRLRLTAVCHGSSYEEWQASIRAAREEVL